MSLPNIRRINKWRSSLRKISPNHFNLNLYFDHYLIKECRTSAQAVRLIRQDYHNSGTIACAGGYVPLFFPTLWKKSAPRKEDGLPFFYGFPFVYDESKSFLPIIQLAAFFKLPHRIIEWITQPHLYYYKGNTPIKDVIARIDFIAEVYYPIHKKYGEDIADKIISYVYYVDDEIPISVPSKEEIKKLKSEILIWKKQFEEVQKWLNDLKEKRNE